MKKINILVIVITVFSFAFTLNLKSTTLNFTEKAFASGSCCAEEGSICAYGGYIMHDAYYKAEGSCGISLIKHEEKK